MSLILDALNRADKERSEQQLSPNLYSAPSSSAPTARPLKRWLIEALVIVAALGIFFYSYYFQPTQINSEPMQRMDSSLEPATPAVSDIHTEPQADVTFVKPDIIEPVEVEVAAKASATAAAPATNPPQDNAIIAQLYQQKATPELKEKPAPVKAPSGSATEATPKNSTQTILQQIPLLATLPTRFQRSIPNIEYSVHVYNDEDGTGIVNLNGAMRRVGAKIEPGLRVIAVLPDSVVLDFNGTQFRLLALNSWMNL